MANYLEKIPFNNEMLVCINQNKLTNKSIEMFTLLATEVSRNYNFKYPEERQDAISSALHDFCAYWKGYKYKPVYNVFFERNIKEDEKIIIKIPFKNAEEESFHTYEFVAKKKPILKNEFEIGSTENRSIENLSNMINNMTDIAISTTIHKVTKKITFIDKINDVGVYGEIEIHHKLNDQLVKSKQKKFDKTSTVIKDKFYEPSSAFNWATSVAINGILKSMDKMRPKEWRNGKLLNFSELTNEDDDLYGI